MRNKQANKMALILFRIETLDMPLLVVEITKCLE